MSQGKRRLSQITSHLASPGANTSSTRTLTTKPIKETFRTKQDYKYFLPIQSRWSDNDCYGHVNNSVYNHYFDTVVNVYLIKHCGLDINSKTKPLGVVVASQATFYASASYPNLITAGLTVSKIGRTSITYRIGIFEADNPLACVVGGFTHVFVNNQDRRPVTEIPDEILNGVKNLVVE
ncbi:hypothetical protein HPULCUR_008846 [Helicostylum pulchrum]|uniref:Thioesterase domain-containing protein n=1 Tax=Helicostylum pulchrum TaxID=562976 RepID=A0ABP9Y8R7_9FUNG